MLSELVKPMFHISEGQDAQCGTSSTFISNSERICNEKKISKKVVKLAIVFYTLVFISSLFYSIQDIFKCFCLRSTIYVSRVANPKMY